LTDGGPGGSTEVWAWLYIFTHFCLLVVEKEIIIRKIFVPKTEEVTEGWRKLPTGEP
jgi:hypothetical protein